MTIPAFRRQACAWVIGPLLSAGALAAPIIILPPLPAASAAVPSAASQALSEGYAALLANDLAAAEAAFTRASKAEPQRALPYLGLAEVAAQRDRAPQVEAFLKQALAAEPAGLESQRAWGRHLARAGRFADAERVFKKALVAHPKAADLQVDLGNAYLLGLKNPKAAEQAFSAATRSDPALVAAYLGWGRALAAQRRLDEAAAQYTRAAQLAPKDPVPVHTLARLLAARGQADQALAALERAIAIDPGFLPAYIDRGDLFLAGNDIDRAIATYRAGTQAARNPATAYFRLGKALEAKGQWAESDAAYLAAVKDDPKMFAAYNNLAFNAATRKERLDEALVWARKAIELAPTNATLYDTLGWVHRARGELDPAAKAMEKAVAAQPALAGAQYRLGLVYADQGRKREAIAAFRAALQADPKFRGADDARARLKALGAAAG